MKDITYDRIAICYDLKPGSLASEFVLLNTVQFCLPL